MTTTTAPFHASFDHSEDVACCDSFIAAGELIVVAPDGSVWHPECAADAGYDLPEENA